MCVCMSVWMYVCMCPFDIECICPFDMTVLKHGVHPFGIGRVLHGYV